jgi:3-hydroxyisobutyrate dehydrogenase
MRIGFIGLGNMGGPMALNLLKAGHTLSVFDLSAESVKRLTDAGATAAASPAELAADKQDVIVTMLPAAAHVKSVYLGDNGLLAQVVGKPLFIDSSTIDPHSAREVAKAAVDAGLAMLDAPVSGGTGGAQAGTLTFMVGGTEADFNQAQPILAAMGKNIVYCGAAGAGQAAKVANNMLLAITMIGTAEAMSLGTALGVDPKVLAGIINTSSGRCWSSDTYNPFPGVMENVPSARGYTGGFGTDLMLKDLGLAAEAAKQVRQPVLMGGLAQQLYQSFSLQGNGGLDFSAIIKMFRKDEQA